MNGRVILSRKARNKIKQIYEWEDDIYSVHLEENCKERCLCFVGNVSV